MQTQTDEAKRALDEHVRRMDLPVLELLGRPLGLRGRHPGLMGDQVALVARLLREPFLRPGLGKFNTLAGDPGRLVRIIKLIYWGSYHQ